MHTNKSLIPKIVREVRSVWERDTERERDRERERERRKWHHHCRAKIGDEFKLPLPKIRTFRFSLHTSRLSLLQWSPLWCWNSQWVHTFRCQNICPLCYDSLKWHEPCDEWPKTQDKWSNPAQSFPSKKWIKLIPKTIGNRNRDCAWGGSGW